MSETEVPPPLNRPALGFRQARTYWFIVCGFTAFTVFFVFEFLHGRAKAEVSAVWFMVGLNLAGHALLFPIMMRARRWEENNRTSVLAAVKAVSQK